jgi:hypothetical protein
LNNDDYVPQVETLNAIAVYLGYKHWDDLFIKENKTGIGLSFQSLRFGKKMLKISLAFLVIGILVSLFYIAKKDKEKDYSKIDYHFELSDSIVKYPGSVRVDYNFDNFKNTDIWLNVGRKTDSILLNREKDHIIVSVSTPGVFRFKLYADNSFLEAKKVLSYSENWDVSAVDLSDYFPLYKNYREGIENSVLTVRRNEIERLKTVLDYKNFWTKFTYMYPFDVSLDSTIFVARIKGDDVPNNTYCNDLAIAIYGNYGDIQVHFSNSGCNSILNSNFSEIRVRGSEDELPGFLLDIGKWHVYKIVTKNNICSVYIDDVLSGKFNYKVNMGEVYGLRIKARGIGAVDYVKLEKNSGKIIYYEDF